MMKAIFLALLITVLLLPLAGIAQIITVTDTGCEGTQCPPIAITPTSCTSASFSVPTSGTYYIDAWTVCRNSIACWNCMSCVTIWSSAQAQPIAVCASKDCVTRDCHSTCKVDLHAGQPYTIQVCLEPCGDVTDCSHCTRDCFAGGCVRTVDSRPCYPNP